MDYSPEDEPYQDEPSPWQDEQDHEHDPDEHRVRHLSPDQETHLLSVDCPCKPQLAVPCPECWFEDRLCPQCEGRGFYTVRPTVAEGGGFTILACLACIQPEGCWRCEGQALLVVDHDPLDLPLLVVHNSEAETHEEMPN